MHPNDAAMAKRQTKPTEAKYALSDLRISKVSLVDSPAVPKSVFVIAKRADESDSLDPKLVTDRENTEENTSIQKTDASAAIPQIDEVCKKLDALTATIQKFMETVVAKQAEPVPAATPKPASSRLDKHVKLLTRLDKRVNGSETLLRSVTGELPPDEE